MVSFALNCNIEIRTHSALSVDGGSVRSLGGNEENSKRSESRLVDHFWGRIDESSVNGETVLPVPILYIL